MADHGGPGERASVGVAKGALAGGRGGDQRVGGGDGDGSGGTGGAGPEGEEVGAGIAVGIDAGAVLRVTALAEVVGERVDAALDGGQLLVEYLQGSAELAAGDRSVDLERAGTGRERGEEDAGNDGGDVVGGARDGRAVNGEAGVDAGGPGVEGERGGGCVGLGGGGEGVGDAAG